MDIYVYVDGSTINNPGIGGWAFCIVDPSKNVVLFQNAGCCVDTTNNRMELTAAIRGLGDVISRGYHKSHQIVVYSDSQYVVKGISTWIKSWKSKGWVDVKNRDLWEQLELYHKQARSTFKWIRGHDGNHYNELVDRLANEAASERYYEG
jgi:ribonuclease HI